MPELAVSTWSLHRELGPIYPSLDLPEGGREADLPYGPGRLTLLETPDAVAAMGIHNLEICHFHFPRTDPDYLDELVRRLDEAGVRLLTVLIDAGDITAPDPEARERDLERIRRWIDIAARVGAGRVRVIAGDSGADPEGAAIRRSIAGLSALADYARPRSVGVITENWRQLAMPLQDLLAILDGTGEAVGLCADFGNYRGPSKYDDLQTILPRASTIHAKANFPQPGQPDLDDFRRCLDLARAADFTGAYVLIFDGPGDERASLSQMAGVVRPYL